MMKLDPEMKCVEDPFGIVTAWLLTARCNKATRATPLGLCLSRPSRHCCLHRQHSKFPSLSPCSYAQTHRAMTTVFSAQPSGTSLRRVTVTSSCSDYSPCSGPNENWDEDFDFDPTQQGASTSGVGPNASLSTRASEDWDREPTTSIPIPAPTTSSSFPTTPSKNARNPDSDFFQPSTPARRPFLDTTENWDDDFEDADSPAKKTPSNKPTARKNKSSLRSHRRAESWDEEFDLPTHTPSKVKPRYTNIDDHPDDSEEDDFELGMSDKEEEKTVTGRTRRAQVALAADSPPPPVPPIPFSLMPPHAHEQPNSRSPNASVFSLPTSQGSVAPSYSSTTHLRATMSRTSIGTSGFSSLPPSPPIHKERERRRLRKKSRPHPEALPTLMDRRSTDSGSSYDSSNSPSASDGVFSPPTSSTPPDSTTMATPKARKTQEASSKGHRNSLSFVNLASSPPLLSRLNSVKKWTGRKKRSGSTPAESMVQERPRYPLAGERFPYQPIQCYTKCNFS